MTLDFKADGAPDPNQNEHTESNRPLDDADRQELERLRAEAAERESQGRNTVISAKDKDPFWTRRRKIGAAIVAAVATALTGIGVAVKNIGDNARTAVPATAPATPGLPSLAPSAESATPSTSESPSPSDTPESSQTPDVSEEQIARMADQTDQFRGYEALTPNDFIKLGPKAWAFYSAYESYGVLNGDHADYFVKLNETTYENDLKLSSGRTLDMANPLKLGVSDPGAGARINFAPEIMDMGAFAEQLALCQQKSKTNQALNVKKATKLSLVVTGGPGGEFYEDTVERIKEIGAGKDKGNPEGRAIRDEDVLQRIIVRGMKQGKPFTFDGEAFPTEVITFINQDLGEEYKVRKAIVPITITGIDPENKNADGSNIYVDYEISMPVTVPLD